MSVSELQDALRIGLAMVSELWRCYAKNWVTSVHAADIDNDGDIEIITGSRDGRVCVFTKGGDPRWARVIGSKAWVGTLTVVPDASEARARIFAGTRDGKIFALDKDGKTVGLDGKLYSFNRQGRAIEEEKEQGAYWHKSEHVIRQIILTPGNPCTIVAGSEDRCVYALDYDTGALRWTFPTQGRVRSVFACDLNGDGLTEILVGSGDKHLYVLDSEGHCLNSCNIGRQIYTLCAADVDKDGEIEILLGTDSKDLVALTPDLQCKWTQSFANRLLCLQVTDLDGDGHNEIIAGSEDQHLYFLDAHGHVQWRYNLGYRIFSIYALDFDRDGQVEVLAGSEDNRVHAFRVRLVKNLGRKIRRYYSALGRPAPDEIAELSVAERGLLQDFLEEDAGPHESGKSPTLEHAECLIGQQEYTHALAELLRLEQQKVQSLWHRDKIGHIRALYLGDISGDAKREIVIGTDDGGVQAFNTVGKSLWNLHLGGQILALQTGYLDRGKWQDILACTSDHHLYVVSGTRKKVKREAYIDEWMSSLHLSAADKQSKAEVIVGTEDKKLYLYGNDFSAPVQTISTPQGIKIVCAYNGNSSHEERVPEIIAGSLENAVYGYTRRGTLLWQYRTTDRVQAVSLKDLDGDGQVEIIVGSEDRNIHILDSQGKLKWRYYTPHRVLAVEAFDVDGDGQLEILLGCGDGYLYVLSAQGDLLWQYQSNDRIRVVRAEDIDDDGNVEIALGSEDRLELLRVVNTRELNELIDRCWYELQQQQPEDKVIATLLHSPDAYLRAFALNKYTERQCFSSSDFVLLDEFSKDNSIQVRLALIRLAMKHYALNPEYARDLLNQLSTSQELEVRVGFVNAIHLLMAHDWNLGFEYLERFSRNIDRVVRRTVVRKLHQFIDTPYEPSAILNLLLAAAQDDESDWIKQEGARTLAHFLDVHLEGLVLYLYLFITRGIEPKILQHITHHARTTKVLHTFSVLVPLLSGMDETNAQERVEQAVIALEEVKTLKHGRDVWLLYCELYRLLCIKAIEEIARYQCNLTPNSFTPGNEHFPTVLHTIDRLSSITRILRIYLRRSGINDRLNSLLEAINAIDMMYPFVEHEYTSTMLGEPMSRLPDRTIFEVILKQWHTLVKAQLSELSGRPELKVVLQTRSARREEEIGILLLVSNKGRSSANNIKITLLDNEDFSVIGNRSFETETIFPQEELQAEFVIRPRAMVLSLIFEIVYYDEIVYSDSESLMKMMLYEDRLELNPVQKEFKYISNPYSTGTPTHDSKMFYGREKDIEVLHDNLARTSAKSVIVLYGQRRSGKTTLLLHLVNSSVLDGSIVLLVDMQHESYKITISKFLYRMAFHICRTLAKRGITVEAPVQKDFAADPTFAFDLFLDEVEAHLAGQKIILLLDEFEVLEEQVNKKQLEPEIFEYLRSLMQHRQCLNFLLSGTHKIEELTKGYWSVFFNIARHYRLSRLTPKDAEALITGPVAGYLEYEPYAVTKIRYLTGDQPYLIHLVCRSLVDYCNEKQKAFVTIHDVSVVQKEVMQTGQIHFDWIWDKISQDERIALAAIAEGRKEEGRVLSLSEIEDIYRHSRLPFKRENVLAAIKTLIENDVVEEVSDDIGESVDRIRYRIPVGLIRRWLRKEKSLELIGKEIEIYS